MMKEYPLDIFQDYTFLNDEHIFKNILQKLDKKELEQIQIKLPELVKLVDMKDIHRTLEKLQTNLSIIDHALEDKENDFLYNLRDMNKQSLKFITELYIMLENRELK